MMRKGDTCLAEGTLKVFEAFAGYGSQSLALQRLGIEYEVVGISEIDKNAIIAYYAVHSKDILNFGDISKINVYDLPKFDLFTYSFPCQDLAPQGKQSGLIRGKTRSGLLYECERIIEYIKPKYLVMENVKNLINKRFKPQFEDWLVYLEKLGYKNQWFILNAKDFGIPQSRERVFCVSILNEEKQLNLQKTELKKTLFDFLDEPNDSLFIAKTDVCINGNGAFRGRQNEDGKWVQRLELRKDNCCNTLTTVSKDNIIVQDGKYRYLTGRECLRLMGLFEEEIDSISSVLTNNILVKLAGNSIVIPVIEEVFRRLLV